MSDRLRSFLSLLLVIILGTAGCFSGAYVGIKIDPYWSPGIVGLMLFGAIIGAVIAHYANDKLSLG